MIKEDPDERYESFSEVFKDISIGVLSELNFTQYQKSIYQEFARNLVSKINHHTNIIELVEDDYKIIDSLEDLIRLNSLEEYLEGNDKLISVFVSNGYSYKTSSSIAIDVIRSFYRLLIDLSDSKRRVVVENIVARLRDIKIVFDKKVS